MGFFPTIKEMRSSLATPEKWLVDWFKGGVETKSGISVNENTAVNFSAVFNAVTIISGTIMQLPFILYKKDKNGVRERATEHPLYDLMHRKVNKRMTASFFRQTMQAHLVLWGNAYAQIIYGKDGRVKELWPLRPGKMKVELVNNEPKYPYQRDNGGDYVFGEGEILHLAGLGYDGVMGYSVVQLARETIGLGMAMDEYQARFYGSGTHPGIVVKHPGKLSNETHQHLQKSLSDKYSGLGNSHKLMVLEDGMEPFKLDMPLADAEFIASKRHTVEDIARWFNLPVHMLKDLERATNNNIEHQSIEFTRFNMAPWFTLWQDQCGMVLISESEQKTHWFEFILDALLRADTQTRYEAESKAVSGSIMTPNEVRKLENLPPIEGGDRLFVAVNLMPIDQAGQNILKADTAKRVNALIQGLYTDAFGRMTRAEVNGINKLENKDTITVITDFYDSKRDYFEKVLNPVIEFHFKANNDINADAKLLTRIIIERYIEDSKQELFDNRDIKNLFESWEKTKHTRYAEITAAKVGIQ